MARKLIANVEVDGRWYGPAYPDAEMSKEIADKVTNPAAWDEPPEPVTAQPAADFGTAAGAPVPRAGDGAGTTTGQPVGFNPDASIAELTTYVGDDADRARAVLEAERAKGEDGRKTLVERLEAISTSGG